MGKRSRKRASDGGAPLTDESPRGSSRADRDAARRRRARALATSDDATRRRAGAAAAVRRRRAEDRPPPPWGAFPLTEIVALLALVLFVGSFFVGGVRGPVMFLAAGVLGCLVGLELALREHLTGFRSHTTLLALAAGVVTMAGIAYGLRFTSLVPLGVLGLSLAAGAAAFTPSFILLRRRFRRRSGGLSVRY